MSEAEPTSWFAYRPVGDTVLPPDTDDIHTVYLAPYEYTGPFWYNGGHLSDEFEDLHEWLGISRGLYDDVMTWSREPVTAEGYDDRGDELLRRLREEIDPSIGVTRRR